MAGLESRITGRLRALNEAIGRRNWDDVIFHFNNVVHGVGRLVASIEYTRLPDDEVWEPLTRAEAVPMPQTSIDMLTARGADQAFLDEMAGSEIWQNSIYSVLVKRAASGDVMELSIRRGDRQPVHDWRHFQMIKSQLAGDEVEAMEIYPAESRLMDTANQYYIWCLPPGMRIDVGWVGPRLLADADEQNGLMTVQRALPKGWTSTFAEVYQAGQQE